MVWIIIINKKDKIDLVQAESYEASDYKFFPDSEGNSIWFEDYDDAISWIKEKIKPELICTESKEVRHIALRSKFLK